MLLRVGDYLSTDRDLFCVERVVGDFVMLEDCRDGTVVEVAMDEVLLMNPVRRAAAPEPS